MNKIKITLLGALLFAATIPAVRADNAIVNWGAAFNGLALQDGTPLDAGSALRIGTFTNLSDAQITLNGANIAYLNSNFVEFGSSTIGTGAGGADSYFIDTSTANATALGLVGDQIVIWAFSTNAPNILTAQQHGIFYMSTNFDFDWDFPGDVDFPGNTTSIEFSDMTAPDFLTLTNGATILWGAFGTGNDAGIPYFNLEVVPEPSTYAMLLVGIASLGAYSIRRRARK